MLSQEPNASPQTKARKRKRKRKLTDESTQPQKRSQSDLASASILTAESHEPADIVRPMRQEGKYRPCDPRDGYLNKPHKPSAAQPVLCTENLEKLQIELDYSEKIESVATPGVPSRGANDSETNDPALTQSQRSTGSLKFYRYNVLARARMRVHSEYPPAEIQKLLDVIFTRRILDERRNKISNIARETTKKLGNKTLGAHREDDFIETLYDAFCKMFIEEKFNCPRKAGTVPCMTSVYVAWRADSAVDWNPNLKPDVQQDNDWDLEALYGANDTDDVDRPSERQQATRFFPPSIVSQPPSQPHAFLQPMKQDGAVKNPRPNFTLGHHHSTIVGAMMECGLTKSKADRFLRVLQEQQKVLSDPTTDYLNVRFPIQTFEGKAYATGSSMMECENQAVVSGACMVNLQQQLIDVHKTFLHPSKESTNPFAFSLCMEGPVIQLWVHYALEEEGIRTHYMNLLYLCNGALHDTLEGLLLKWEQLMSWYSDEFLKEIAGRLYDLAIHTARS